LEGGDARSDAPQPSVSVSGNPPEATLPSSKTHALTHARFDSHMLMPAQAGRGLGLCFASDGHW
jgi:hypothetical protein